MPSLQDLVPDVLSDIFLECLPENGFVRTQRMLQAKAPFNVSQVCRHWRFTSHLTPRLWARLCLDCAIGGISFTSALSVLKVFLRRSSNTEFHFTLYCGVSYHILDGHPDNYRQDYKWPLLEALLNELAVHHERVKSVALKVPGYASYNLQDYSFGDMSALQHLELQISNSRRETVSESLPPRLGDNFWAIASRVTSLKIYTATNLIFDWTTSMLFPNLKYLEMNITYCHAMLLHLFLSFCPALKTLKLNSVHTISFMSLRSTTGFSQSIFPSIRSLELQGYYDLPSSIAHDILKYMCFPNLRCFTLRPTSGLESDIEKFLTKCRPPLEELYLSGRYEVEEEPVIRTLKLLPGLKKLRIPLQAGLLEALILSNAGFERCCPLLEEIIFDISQDVTAENWGRMTDVIRSRWRSPIAYDQTGPILSSPELGSYRAALASTTLRIVKFPGIKEQDWMTHPLYESINDCVLEGLDIGFHDEQPTGCPNLRDGF